MKFWQYVVGSGLAILIFSGAVFSEYSKYQKVSFLEKNPFTLTGEFDYPKKGYKDFIDDDGEYIRVFHGSEVKIDTKSREIISGEVFLGGSFFSKEDLNVNNISFGNLNLKYHASNVVISRDSTTHKTKILNYGRTAELYFPNQEIPFLIPSETEIIIDDTATYPLSKNGNFYKQSLDFQLKIIDWDNPLTKILKEGSEDVYILRNSFKKFATNLPNLWAKNRLNSLKSISSGVVGKNKSNKNMERVLSQMLEIKSLISAGDKLSQNLARVSILELNSQLSDTSVQNSLDSNDQWKLFKKSQKIWLPTINDEFPEWLYINMWQPKLKGTKRLSQIMDMAELFSFNIVPDSANNQILSLKKELDKINIENFEEFEISSLRRRLFYLLKNKTNSGEIINQEIIDAYFYIEKLELDVYQDSNFKEKIIEEKVMKIMEIVNEFIHQEDDFSRDIVQNFIKFLQENINLDDFQNKYLTKNEEALSILKKIKLVGVSGLTPSEVETINNIKKEEEELHKLIDNGDPIPEIVDKSIISNSKTLWGFLNSVGININITKFRTKRSSLKFETSFENTQIDKKKISGIFDYNGQIFKRLNLGTATIRKLKPHAISAWMREIKGKFEPIIIEEPIKPQKETIPQNSRKALVNKQFLKDLLVSLGFSVSKTNIIIISKDSFKLSASNIQFSKDGISGNGLALKFNIETKKFYDIFAIENKGKIYLSEDAVDGRTLQEKSREFFKTEEKGD